MKLINILALSLLTAFAVNYTVNAQTYKLPESGQEKFYNNQNEITAPSEGNTFYGEDAQYTGNKPSYKDNGDGTITDNVTGLMWQKSPDFNGDGVINYSDKMTYAQAIAGADTFKLAGYTDWRLPSLKELYSLIMFYGIDPSGYTGTSTSGLKPFIDTAYFDFNYGDQSAGERIIDAQYATTTLYTGTTMMNNPTMFGVNFADGRIKGYPYEEVHGSTKKYYVLYVRGNKNYGINNFKDNGDGTITDGATGLMWAKDDSKKALNWEEALAWAQSMDSANYLGYSDWRLPNVKELQSIVDYSRSPQATNSPAIDPLFNCTEITDEGGNPDYPFYWSSTTHENMMTGAEAAYVAFGKALGWMQDPITGAYQLMDVHGAGAQRSDPKQGNPADYPYGHGPQGDVIRIYNYVRLVRDASTTTSTGESGEHNMPDGFTLNQNYPNPFNPTTRISYQLASSGYITLNVFDVLGNLICPLFNGYKNRGSYSVTFNSGNLSSGLYFCRLTAGALSKTIKMVSLK